MPAPGTSAKMPLMRNTVAGHRRTTENTRESSASIIEASSEATATEGCHCRYSQ